MMWSIDTTTLQSGQPSLDWVSLVVDLVRLVWRLIRSGPQGLYEVIEYDAVLELIDTRGRQAVFKKRLRVRFLQDNVIPFQDYLWGDGEMWRRHTCAPGIVVDRYQEGNRRSILLQPLQKGRGLLIKQ